MTTQELRRVDSRYPWARDVNQLVDVELGNLAARSRRVGHDGTRRNINGGASLATGEYSQIFQSIATGGPHLAILHSGTANGATVAPTPANAVLLVNDTYVGIGRGTQARFYGAAGSSYAQLTADNNGTLTLGGSGAGAGDLVIDDLTMDSLTLNTADTSAAIRTLVHSQENGAARWRMGFNASDHWTLINAAGNTAALTVDQETGNTTVAGTLTSTGAFAASSTANVVGNFSVATNKFTVAASSGDTAVAGALGVTGLTTTAGVTSSADVTLTGTGRRILAPFSEATTADRAMFQSSTTNGNTNVGVIPNGTATTAAIFAYNSSSPGTSAFARLRVTSSVVDLSSAVNGAVTVLPMTFTVGSNERARLTEAGLFLVGDTTNANMTQGVTINQGASDDESLALKSSDVSHGATAVTEDDTYAFFSKNVAANGGLRITALDDTANIALRVRAIATTADTTKSTSAVGAIVTDSYLRSGTGTASLATASSNLFVVRENDQAQFLVDLEGDVHYNGTTNAGSWDDYPDVALLEAFRITTAPGVETNYRQRFSDDVTAHAEVLARTGVITLNPDGRHFVSTKALNGLLIDAIRMLASDVRAQASEITELRRALNAA